MIKATGFRIPAAGLFVLFAFTLWNCNLNESGSGTLLRMSLPDSLSQENGKYDRVVIDLYDADNTLTHPAIFDEAYNKETDASRLANLRLSTKAPDPLLIKITAYKNDTAKLILQIRVNGDKPVELTPIHPNLSPLGGDDSEPPPAGGNATFTLNPKTMTLYTGGESGKVTVTRTGGALDMEYHLSSSDITIAKVDSNGMVKGIKAGEAILKVRTEGNLAISDECTVQVITDPPIVTISADQSIASGELAVFQVSVTQAYGTVVSIRADMDGDGIFEQIIPTQSEAEFLRKYEAAGTVPVKFQVEDSEGNVVTETRKVSIAAKGAPIVNILEPSKDTIVNTLSYKIRFSILDSAKNIDATVDSTVSLKEGANSIRAARKNDWGEGADVVVITVDSKKPGIPEVSAPAASRTALLKWTWNKANADGNERFKVKVNNGAEVDVGEATEYIFTATVDSTVYGLSVQETDSVAGDGPWSARKNILYDSKTPDPVLSRNAAITNAPKWTWTSNGGSGTFRWHYKGNAVGSAGTGTADEFAPTNLSGGTHTLCVQELDSPEWGEVWGKIPETCLGIEVDKTGPVITELNPKDGYITNQPSITVSYKADGKPASIPCALFDGAETICKTDARDSVGNITPVQVKIWHRKNVIFVRKGVLGGKKDGSSWQDAFDELHVALDTGKVYQAGTEIWVSAGAYEAESELSEFGIRSSNFTVLGGFPASGLAVSASARQPTLFESILLDNLTFFGSASSIVWDGFTHPYTLSRGGVMGSYGENITIRQCRFTTPDGGGGLYVMVGLGSLNTPTILQNCSFINIDVSRVAVSVSGKALISNCTFSGITSLVNGPAIRVSSGGNAVVEASIFRNNRFSSEPTIPDNILTESGTLSISGSQVEGGRASITGEGLVTYGTDNTEPQ